MWGAMLTRSLVAPPARVEFNFAVAESRFCSQLYRLEGMVFLCCDGLFAWRFCYEQSVQSALVTRSFGFLKAFLGMSFGCFGGLAGLKGWTEAQMRSDYLPLTCHAFVSVLQPKACIMASTRAIGQLKLE